MRLQRNYYEILGVPRTASPQEIKHKYHDLARQYHPDRATDKDLAQRLFVQINRAYGTLMNPEKRALYDASLFMSVGTSAGDQRVTAPRQSEAAPAPARNGAAPGPAPSAPMPNPSASNTPPPPTAAQQIKQWLDEANLAQIRGNMDRAKALCQSVIAADPKNFPGLVLMGDLLAQQGRQDDALAQYRTAIAIQPTNRVLREKIARLEAILARKATVAAAASSQAASAISSHIPPVPGDAPAPRKSLIDRIMNLGK